MNKEAVVGGLKKRLMLVGLPTEIQEEVIARLGKAVIERTMLLITESLSEEEAKEVTHLQDEGKLEDVVQFISLKHPELDEEIVTITHHVVDEFLSAQE
jgi:hypothetical protein